MASRYPFAIIKEKLHARRGEVTDFAIGGHRLELPEELTDRLHADPQLALRPATPDAVRNFKDAAANLLRTEYDVNVDHEHIVPIPGGRVAMTAVAACALQPNDSVLVTEPGYPAFARLASHFHANVLAVPLDPAQGFAPDLSALSAEQLASVRVYSLNYPNNPSGGVLQGEARQSLFDAAEQSHAVVFNDNVYGPLCYESEPSSLLSHETRADVVELHALTKLYPIGPQGASFVAGNTDEIRKIGTYAEFAWAPMSGMQIAATTWCFRDVDGRARIREFFRNQLSALRETLIELGFEPYPTPGGIYVLCKTPSTIAGKAVSTAEEAAVMLMDDFDLAVVPFERVPNHYLRFTSMYAPEDLEYLKSLAGKIGLNQPA